MTTAKTTIRLTLSNEISDYGTHTTEAEMRILQGRMVSELESRGYDVDDRGTAAEAGWLVLEDGEWVEQDVLREDVFRVACEAVESADTAQPKDPSSAGPSRGGVSVGLGATIIEQGNGYPRVGEYVSGHGELYRVVQTGSGIHTDNPRGNYISAMVESADWDDCAEGDVHTAMVRLDSESQQAEAE